MARISHREQFEARMRADAAERGTLEHYDRVMHHMEQERLDRRTERRMEQETRASQQAEEAGYQQTKAIIEALDSGMPLEQVEAAVEGRPYGAGLKRCEMCGQPTRHRMTSARGSVCPDCYDRANE